jgi:hypothetical protein
VGLANYLASSSTNAPVASSFQSLRVYVASTVVAQVNPLALKALTPLQ